MIYIFLYLAIGIGFSVYMPIFQARTRRKAAEISREKIEAMSQRDLAVLKFALDSVYTPFKTWQIILGGLLWPTQIVSVVIAHFWGERINRRAEQRALAGLPVCRCIGCQRNLVTTPRTDCIEDKESTLVRFVCGHCGAASDWDFADPNAPTFLREVGRRDVAS